jgi:hypothetical protein
MKKFSNSLLYDLSYDSIIPMSKKVFLTDHMLCLFIL